MVIYDVRFSTGAKRDLLKVPEYIYDKLEDWIEGVREIGVEQMRKIPGYHDEPLRGKRKGQRSIRLNRSYRAIYAILPNGKAEIVEIQEVNKHDY